MKTQGEGSFFTEGVEDETIHATVGVLNSLEPSHDGATILIISKGENIVGISPETLQSILDWYNR